MAKPTNIKFHISFNKGMNPYIGLEEYISWDTCGVERGRFINANAFNKYASYFAPPTVSLIVTQYRSLPSLEEDRY